MKGKENKIFLIIIALALICVLLFASTEVVLAQDEQAIEIGENYFSENSYTLSGGSYILTSNITTTESIVISGTVTLDLDGYVIDGQDGMFSVITVPQYATLNLNGYDSVNNTYNGITYAGGLITGGSGTDYGILRFGQSAWTNDDSLRDSTHYHAYFGGGVMVNGTFNMNGGTIFCRSRK